jgi:hypothetical protein
MSRALQTDLATLSTEHSHRVETFCHCRFDPVRSTSTAQLSCCSHDIKDGFYIEAPHFITAVEVLPPIGGIPHDWRPSQEAHIYMIACIMMHTSTGNIGRHCKQGAELEVVSGKKPSSILPS